MAVPKIGGQQLQVDPSQAVARECVCGCPYFKEVYRVAIISKFAPGNKTNQDITMRTPVYICLDCGEELFPAGEKKEEGDGEG